jgi:hypothetical protein
VAGNEFVHGMVRTMTHALLPLRAILYGSFDRIFERAGAVMDVKKNGPAMELAKRMPSRLADAELDHLERMVQYVTRQTGANSRQKLDFDYWRKRLRVLTQTHDLMLPQKNRVVALMDMLERELMLRSRATPA